MKKKFGTLLIFAGLNFAIGCATTANYEKILQSWVGNNVDRLVTSWGPPNSSYPLSNGGSVLQYTNQRTAQIGGSTYTTPQTTFQSGTANVYGSNGVSTHGTYSGTSTTYVQTQAPTQTIALNCTTRFTVDKNGIIANWTWQGNNCKARSSEVPNTVLTQSPSETAYSFAIGQTIKPSMEPIGFYKDASRDSELVQKLHKKDDLVVDKISGEWVQAHTKEGIQGWIMSSWVRKMK